MDTLYLDYNATTPLDPLVSGAMGPYLAGGFGNPSSLHEFGKVALQALILARTQVASMLHCFPDEVVFTGGGTESNNFAIKGAAFANRSRGNHIIISSIEHPAVSEVCNYLEEEGFQITRVGVDAYGIVDPEEVRDAIHSGTILVSIMHANNETGSIQPIRQIAKIVRESGILFHTDAAQSVGKIPVDVNDLQTDLLSVAGHKLYAPKGVGALFIRRGVKLMKFMHGADHEADRRAGTENVLGIVGLGKAAEIISSLQSSADRWNPGVNSNQSLSSSQTITYHAPPWSDGTSPPKHSMEVLRDMLFDGIRNSIPEVRLNGHPDLRLPNTLSLGFPGVEANTILQAMTGVAASAGAACHAGEEGVSGVLSAMHVPTEYAMGTIRFSVGRMTTEEEIKRAIPIIINAYKEVQGSGYKIQAPASSYLPPNSLEGVYPPPWKGKAPEGSSRDSGSKSPLADIGTPVQQSQSLTGDAGEVRLTEYTHALGCACKIRPQLLEEVLRNLPRVTDPKVLVGPETSDDAAVYLLNSHQALVQTVDVIPPVVDDPYIYGMIAAANAISDIYAMGGTPLYALNIVGFPEKRLPLEVLQEILKGASDKAAEAGIQIIGGHSVELTEPLFGLAVTGVAKPGKVVRNRGVMEGDVLILTKPLGTGILTTALKRGLLDQGTTKKLEENMFSLNRISAEVMMQFPVHACTDVTGFGLMGHVREMIAGENLNIRIDPSQVPLLDGATEMAAQGIIPGGTRNNFEFVNPYAIWDRHISEIEKMILCDAQTSGGLLIAVPSHLGETLIETLKRSGVEHATLIGAFTSGKGMLIVEKDRG